MENPGTAAHPLNAAGEPVTLATTASATTAPPAAHSTPDTSRFRDLVATVTLTSGKFSTTRVAFGKSYAGI